MHASDEFALCLEPEQTAAPMPCTAAAAAAAAVWPLLVTVHVDMVG